MAKPSELISRLARALAPLGPRHRMRPFRVPPHLAYQAGCWASTPIEISTTIEVGDGFLARLQVAQVRSPNEEMSALTAIAVPSPEVAAPIFGCDLVAFRGRFVLAAIDLSGGELSDEDGARLAIARDQVLEWGNARDVPDFAQRCFSEHALIAAEGGAEFASALERAFELFFSCFEYRLAHSPVRPWRVGHEEQCRYFAAMRANKRESKAMAKLFGAAWAERYFEGLFFANTLSADAPKPV